MLEVGLAQYSKPKLLIIDELGYLPLQPPDVGMGRGVWRSGCGGVDPRSIDAPQPCGDDPGRQLPALGETQCRPVSPACGRLLLVWHRRRTATDASQGGLGGKQPNSSTGINDRRQPTQPITEPMSRDRNRPHKGGTTPITEPKDRPAVVQFLVSEVAQL